MLFKEISLFFLRMHQNTSTFWREKHRVGYVAANGRHHNYCILKHWNSYKSLCKKIQLAYLNEFFITHVRTRIFGVISLLYYYYYHHNNHKHHNNYNTNPKSIFVHQSTWTKQFHIWCVLRLNPTRHISWNQNSLLLSKCRPVHLSRDPVVHDRVYKSHT
jgi:hypothetical protein